MNTQAEAAAGIPRRDTRLFLLLPIFIGVLSGLLVVCFRVAIEWLKVLLLGSAPHAHQLRLIAAPALVGLLVGLLVRYVFPDARGSGVNQTKAALYIYNGYISSRTMVGKFVTSALAIGSGHSLGPEDPSLQIGAAVASLISRRFHLSRQRMRLFAPVGAAAGLAAAFNAPISAILFVIEEVVGRWNAAVLGSVVLAATSSVVVARWFWGSEPLFRIPAVELRDPRELIAYAVLGLAGGVAAVVFSRGLGYLRPRLRALPERTLVWQPAVAGLLVGLIGLLGLVGVMGPGYDVIDQAVNGDFPWQFLLLLAAGKMLATTLSFASGTPGGMFAPTLFVGAMLGAAIGTVEKILLPHLTGSIGSYALVGMGVLFAGFLRAPLTSVFMVLEVSGNYTIILPVILSNTLAYLIARSLQPEPIFEVFTHQDGLNLPSMEEQREEDTRHIEDAMQPLGVPLVEGSAALAAAEQAIAGQPALLLRLGDGRWYAATAAELESWAALHPPATPVEDCLPAERLPRLYPDLPLDAAIAPLRRWPVLAVSNRARAGSLEGTLTMENLLAAYDGGQTRSR